jgi:hypothetical protein
MDLTPHTYQESIEIAATPEAVYALVSDIGSLRTPTG